METLTQDPYQHPAMQQVTLCDVLHALSDPLRLSIVAAVAGGGERGWGEFDCRVAPSTLSHHMRVLRLAGVICTRREGTRCLVSLRPELATSFPGLLAAVLGAADRQSQITPG